MSIITMNWLIVKYLMNRGISWQSQRYLGNRSEFGSAYSRWKKRAFLLPFVDAFLIDVDIEQKKITIKEMEGLR